MEIEKEPLVSIIIITYNSSKYVLETLESAKNQTFKNIELIISDDGSSEDNTVDICKNWLAENEERFVNSKILTVEENTGIPANCNRGVKASKGEWVKLIAGDDLLFTTCIEDFLKFVQSNENLCFCYSNYQAFSNELNSNNLLPEGSDRVKKLATFSNLNPSDQNKILSLFTPIPAITFFFNRNAFEQVGFFDESYMFLEDWTTYFNITNMGYKFTFLDKKTVYYRFHNQSITRNKDGFIPYFHKNIIKVIEEKFYSTYSFKNKILFRFYKYYIFKYTDYKPSTIAGLILRKTLYVPVKILEKENANYILKFYQKVAEK